MSATSPTDPASASHDRTAPAPERHELSATAHPDAPLHDAPLPPAERTAPSRANFVKSFVYAWNGVVYAIRTQRNARIHMALAVLAIALGIYLHISAVEFAMIFVAITGVFIAEMFNTVAEACVDLATQEYNPLARIAKDVAAGAVLLNAMLSVVIAFFVFGPHLLALALRLLGR